MEKFKGYYFKCSGGEHTLALIPASHGNGASLQLVTEKRAYNIKYPRIFFGEKPPSVKIGESTFGERKIILNVNRDDVKARGILYFGGLTPLKYDIMGPFRFISPILQCRHRVISMKHRVNGNVWINGENCLFRNDNGYIEGDEGCSFPKSYIWAQGFFTSGSVMLSVADVPVLGIAINGVIAVVYVNKKEYRLATYTGAKAVFLKDDLIIIKQGDCILAVKRLSGSSKRLLAPKNGQMSRIIRESPRCKLYCKFMKKNDVIAEFVTEQGSFESEFG